MDVRITTRHVDLSRSFLALAQERTSKLTRYEPRLMAVDLLFNGDHRKLATEARAEVPGRPPMIAHAAAADRRKSLDSALRKLERQLRRERSKRTDYKAAPPAIPPELHPELTPEGHPEIHAGD